METPQHPLTRMFQIYRTALRQAVALWRPLLAVNVAFALLGVVLLAPLPGLLVRGIMHLSGHQVLTDQAIAAALLSPLGFAALVLSLAILVGIATLTQAALMFIALAGGGANPIVAALGFALRRTPALLLFSLQLVIRVLLLTVPFLAVAALIAWALLSAHDINWHLSARPPLFWLATVLIGAVLMAMLVVVLRRLLGWAVALPLLLFAGVTPRRAFAASEACTAGARGLVLGVFLLWGLLAIGLGYGVLETVHLLGTLTVPPLFGHLTLLVLMLGALVALWLLLNLLVSSINASGFALLSIALARRLDTTLGARALPASQGLAMRITPRGLGMALGLTATAAALAGLWLVEGVRVQDQTLVVAHRGAAGRAPENTLAAVRAAIEDGADWVEIDVQETADDAVVVVHDRDFMKLARNPLRVRDGTLAQIQALDVGAWFAPEFAGERVPTLAEVLEAARGKARVVIELKYYGGERALEQRVVEAVEAAGMVDDVAVMSLDYAGVRRLHELRADWTIGLLSARALGDVTRREVDFLAVNTGMLSRRLERQARAAGKPLFVWTVNDPLSLSRLLSRGIHGIITDEPALARQVIAERAGMDPLEHALLNVAHLFGRPLPARGYRDASP